MTTAVTPTGLVVDTTATFLAAMQVDMRSIFGTGIDVTETSIDGQTTGIFADNMGTLSSALQGLFNQLSPDQSVGARLSSVVKLNGIRRQVGQPSLVTWSITCNAGTSLAVGTVFTHAQTGFRFATLATATFAGSGPSSQNVNGQCVDATGAPLKGPNAAPADPTGIYWQPVNPTFGLVSVESALDATLGKLDESDPALHVRRRASVAIPSQGLLDSLVASLENLDGLSYVRVYMNNTNAAVSMMASTGLVSMPAKSLWIIAYGTDYSEVPNIIWLKMGLGPTLFAPVLPTTVNVNDSQGTPHALTYDTAIAVLLVVVVNTTKIVGFPSDGADLIAAAIEKFSKSKRTTQSGRRCRLLK